MKVTADAEQGVYFRQQVPSFVGFNYTNFLEILLPVSDCLRNNVEDNNLALIHW